MLAIIGGTGLANLANLEITRRELIRTPFGEPSGPLTYGRIGADEVVFLARHGYGHTIPPHKVNYRANLWALQSVGVVRVLAVNSVGGIAPEMAPGVLAVPNQLIDYTWGRKHTFFDGDEPKVTHIDFTFPFCERARQLYLQAAQVADMTPIAMIAAGVYGATQGPRLETAAEIERMQRDGCTMVGMTGMPEAALARELRLSYAVLALSMNHAAGLASSIQGVNLDSAESILQVGMERVRHILARAVALHGKMPETEQCYMSHAA